MKPTVLKAACVAIVAVLGAAPAIQAAPTLWRISPETSSIAITFEVDGQPRQGGFGVFRGEATFDPTALADADLRFEIDTASIDLQEPFATDFVKSIDWLFVEEYPQAVYELQKLEHIEGDRFRASGALTMRGQTRPVDGMLTLALGEDRASAAGEAGFSRKEFGVGVGFSTLFVEIGPRINVTFDLTAEKVE